VFDLARLGRDSACGLCLSEKIPPKREVAFTFS
jgi:hypothetical protein